MISLRTAQQLLAQLQANNTKSWFQANQAQVNRDLIEPCNQALHELREFLQDSCQREMTAKAYRLNRDLRFSRDKTPYHTHFRFSIWPVSSIQAASANFHFSVEPDRLVQGTGLFEFGDRARAFRERCPDIDQFLSPIMRLSSPELKRLPAGEIPPENLADHYRRKGLTVWIDQCDLGSNNSTFDLDHLRSLVPLFQWMTELSV